METKITRRRPAGEAEEAERRSKKGRVGTILNDIWSSISKDSRDVVVHERGSTSEDAVDDDFLPGIFNHIIMAHIVTKLLWTDTLKLASVSRTWFHSIRNHYVHVERAAYGSAETYIVLPYNRKSRLEMSQCDPVSIALYSMCGDCCYELPELPPFHAPLPGSYWCTSVALDGKVFVIEFYASFHNWTKPVVTGRMMAFDVAGQGGWQPCENLQGSNGNFQCSILNGKIYAVGGFHEDRLAHSSSTVTSQVYNPANNTWSSIKPVKDPNLSNTVGNLGDKLVVRRNSVDFNYELHDNLDVYDPSKDEWSQVELSLVTAHGWSFHRGFPLENEFEIFTFEGKYYIMDSRRIYNFDSESSRWRDLHTSSFTEIGMGPVNSLVLRPRKVLVINEELLAVVQATQGDVSGWTNLLLRSRSRLGGEDKEIVWRRASIDALSGVVCGISGALRI